MIIVDNNKRTVIKGEVIYGRQVGGELGFPTANIYVSAIEGPPLPNGVYGVRVYHKDVMFNGIMNIGMRPTFKNEKTNVSYEVHILNFNQNIYGEKLMIEILFFIREEKGFETLEHLVKQINQDINIANLYFPVYQ